MKADQVTKDELSHRLEESKRSLRASKQEKMNLDNDYNVLHRKFRQTLEEFEEMKRVYGDKTFELERLTAIHEKKSRRLSELESGKEQLDDWKNRAIKVKRENERLSTENNEQKETIARLKRELNDALSKQQETVVVYRDPPVDDLLPAPNAFSKNRNLNPLALSSIDQNKRPKLNPPTSWNTKKAPKIVGQQTLTSMFSKKSTKL